MTDRSSIPVLVSTDWLADHLGDRSLRIVDASWYLPQAGRDPVAEYRVGHIPGAVFFDLDASSAPESPLPHMLPEADSFARRMSALGLDDSAVVVVYDGSGTNLSAPRVWWMLRAFGHERTTVLDGGLARWKREGRPLETGEATTGPGHFTARLDRRRVRTLGEMRALVGGGAVQIVDMRSAGRFAASEPEPRPGIRGGHIPGSRNIPYTDLITPEGTVPRRDVLEARIRAAGVDPARPVVATCGSGVSACALILALEHLGWHDHAVYDGSWTEWAGRPDTPVETGPIPGAGR
jgi:thiosulfate/3-mercaptopyruvate sulfurtransferase